MEITGILHQKLGQREGVSQSNGNPWKIAEYLVEIPGQYPRHTVFKVKDGQVGRIARFDSLMGKTVTVSFDIDAHKNESDGRWFNDIVAWGIMEYVVGRKIPQTTVAPDPAQNGANEGQKAAQEANANNDGLPF
jgi:hypothetical protein